MIPTCSPDIVFILRWALAHVCHVNERCPVHVSSTDVFVVIHRLHSFMVGHSTLHLWAPINECVYGVEEIGHAVSPVCGSLLYTVRFAQANWCSKAAVWSCADMTGLVIARFNSWTQSCCVLASNSVHLSGKFAIPSSLRTLPSLPCSLPRSLCLPPLPPSSFQLPLLCRRCIHAKVFAHSPGRSWWLPTSKTALGQSV